MAVPFSNTKLRVPKGFQNILEGLAREVLRSQPSDIYKFASSHFENLIKTREETGYDPAFHGAKLEDRFHNNNAFRDRSIDPSNPEQQEAALKIQTKQRQCAAKDEANQRRQEQAATTIQAKVRGDADRNRSSIDIDLNDPEVIQATTKIQASYRGFKARKKSHEDKTTAAEEPEEKFDFDMDDPELDKAAYKIQSSFKRHMSRKNLMTGEHTEHEADDARTKTPVHEEEREEERVEEREEENDEEREEAEEEIDIDLDDPEVQHAATMIQANFKGHLLRKNLQRDQEK